MNNVHYNKCTFIGYQSGFSALSRDMTTTNHDQIILGNNSNKVYTSEAINNFSDQRDKIDIQDTIL